MPLHLIPFSGEFAARLSRRSLLALLLAGCARPYTRLVLPQSPRQSWALLSDVHIAGDLGQTRNGACMAENLRNVLAEVSAGDADHLLINGDIALDAGEPADYASFSELLVPVRQAGIPVHLAVGNHDHRERLAMALEQPLDAALQRAVASIFVGGLHWLMLDSLEHVADVPGSLGEPQLCWLRDSLAQHRRIPSVICLHHNPEPSIWGLRDFERFLEVVLPQRCVKAIIFGHTHRFRTYQREGVHFINQPAVGYRFNPVASLGWLNARFLSGGLALEFRGVTPAEADHGRTDLLHWRTDKI